MDDKIKTRILDIAESNPALADKMLDAFKEDDSKDKKLDSYLDSKNILPENKKIEVEKSSVFTCLIFCGIGVFGLLLSLIAEYGYILEHKGQSSTGIAVFIFIFGGMAVFSLNMIRLRIGLKNASKFFKWAE